MEDDNKTIEQKVDKWIEDYRPMTAWEKFNADVCINESTPSHTHSHTWLPIDYGTGTVTATNPYVTDSYASTHHTITAPQTAIDVELLKKQIEADLRKEFAKEAQKKSEIEWTISLIAISKGTTALIAHQSKFQHGMHEWSIIKTTHTNHFTLSDEYSVNLADWFVRELARKINATAEQVKFFVKKDWIICCKVS